VPIERLHAAFADEAQRALWLPGAPLRLRTATAPKSARLDWGDGDGTTRVSACFLPTGDAKSTVGLMHECLAGAAEAERMKAFWRGRFVTLKQVLER